MAASTKRKRKPKTAPAPTAVARPARRRAASEHDGSGIRFDFDFHGLRTASVAVQERCTEEAGDLIAAAIHQAWLQTADEET